jgi:hypothetical protein
MVSCNVRQVCVWTPSGAEADSKGGIKGKRKFPGMGMVWLSAWPKSITPSMIFKQGTVEHVQYIEEKLPSDLEYGDKIIADDWTCQPDNAKLNIHDFTQRRYHNQFPLFVDRDRWPLSSPDVNPLDYYIWDGMN